MIQNLEVLISFAVVMAGLSLLITILNQMISAALSIRGTTLRFGIQVLLENISPELKSQAGQISHEILSHALVSDAYSAKYKRPFWDFYKLASTIRREELTGILKILKESAPDQPEPWQEPLKKLDALKFDEIQKQLNQWFDTSMERTSERFAIRMRIWTVVFSFLLAFSLHLDSSRLLKQLNSDPSLRAQLIIAGKTLQEKSDEIVKNPGGLDVEKLQKTQEQAKAIVDDLSKTGLEIIEEPYQWGDFILMNAGWKRHLLGIIASGAFLSLGAPFWFNLLKSLTNLKPVPALKVEQEEEKQ